MSEAIWIGSRREPFWDEWLIDVGATTAELRLHRPEAKEVVLEHDEPWEGDGCDYHCIVEDDGLYRLYYLGWETMNPAVTRHVPRPIVVCYAESRDGKNWVKPRLGLCEFGGSKDNNIILDHGTTRFDNFFVFKDTNPACPREELYKGVAVDGNDHVLWCFASADAIRFRKAWRMTDRGKFDSLNVAFWDRHSGRYLCYLRDFHDVPGTDLNAGIRDVRWMASTDFKSWTVPVQIDFLGAEDYPLYTNVIQPYHRADHLFVGFPSRYVERKAWTPNYDQLPGAERRRKRMEVSPRYGLTVTDCVFMSSRDGVRWRRWDEAFMTPGPEREYNWVYGDCYPAYGLIETPSDLPYAPKELSLYTFDNHWGMVPARLRRYTMRIDGFVSYRAPYAARRIVTRPFRFEGATLSVNLATSARGWVRIRLVGDGKALDSVELFGDSLDRIVPFEGGRVASLAGKAVTMEVDMSDADLYSFQFRP
jgi:hypothetical protein